MKFKLITGAVISVVIIVAAVLMAGAFVETNLAGNLQVKQAAVIGELTCKLEPGMYWQGFGDIHTYPEAETFYFTADAETGQKRDQSLPTRFNDGAKAYISGSVRVIYPSTCPELVLLHRKFHSPKGVMAKLVLPAVRKALFNSGPHMSAGESYAERRGELAGLAEDQLVFGSILVKKHVVDQPDPITGKVKRVWLLEKRSCAKETKTCINGFVRDPSAFKEFGIRITNFVIDGIKYPKEVLTQIERQRKARMDIITQKAQAKQAEARASKAEAEAKAQIAETRAREEVAKTQRVVRAEAEKREAVLLAEKKRDVSKLDLESARLEKQANIERGQGEANRRKAVMMADGALDKKLKAMVQINQAYAQALAEAQTGALVPSVMMCGNGNGKSSATQWIDLMMAKAAKDLGTTTIVKK